MKAIQDPPYVLHITNAAQVLMRAFAKLDGTSFQVSPHNAQVLSSAEDEPDDYRSFQLSFWRTRFFWILDHGNTCGQHKKVMPFISGGYVIRG
jgi:hypothetical protein